METSLFIFLNQNTHKYSIKSCVASEINSKNMQIWNCKKKAERNYSFGQNEFFFLVIRRKKTGDKFSYDTSHAVCWQNAVLLDGGHLKKMAEINFFSSYCFCCCYCCCCCSINSPFLKEKLMKLFELLSINLICLLNLLHHCGPFFFSLSLFLNDHYCCCLAVLLSYHLAIKKQKNSTFLEIFMKSRIEKIASHYSTTMTTSTSI